MAAGTLPAPGSEHGPCIKPCEHRDCVASRATASATCSWCDEPIGWDTRFYAGDNPGEYVHALCEELAIEEGRAH